MSLVGHTHTEYAPSSHNHNSLYYTKSQVDSLISSASGPKLVWSGNIKGRSSEHEYQVIVTGIPNNVDYIEYTDLYFPERPKIKILKGSTVSVGSWANNALNSVRITFTGTVIKFASMVYGHSIDGFGEGYSQ